MALSVSIRLPYPPSKNRMWRTFRGRQILSKEGRDYYEACTKHLKTEWPYRTIDQPVRLHLLANKPDRRKRDVSNLLHAVGDALQYGGVIKDDCLMYGVAADWCIDIHGDPVIVPENPVVITLTTIKEGFYGPERVPGGVP